MRKPRGWFKGLNVGDAFIRSLAKKAWKDTHPFCCIRPDYPGQPGQFFFIKSPVVAVRTGLQAERTTCDAGFFLLVVTCGSALRFALRDSPAHQLDEHLLEALQVDVELCVNQAHVRLRFQLLGPCQRVTICGSTAQIHIHVVG